MFESIHRYAVVNQKGRFYSLHPRTLEDGIHYLELVQSALHRRKYTYLSDYNCDIILYRLYHVCIQFILKINYTKPPLGFNFKINKLRIL